MIGRIVRHCGMLIVLVSMHFGTLHAQRFEPWRHFTSLNGLPQNSVQALHMDSSGALWISTEGGLVRFDGAAFKRYSLASPNGKGAQRIRQIIPTALGDMVIDDAEGNLFRTHANQVVRRMASKLSRVMVRGSVPTPRTHAWMVQFGPKIATHSGRHGDQTTWYAWNTHDWLIISPDTIAHFKDTVELARTALSKPMVTTWFLNDRCYGLDDAGEYHAIDPVSGECRPVVVFGAGGRAQQWSRSTRIHWNPGDAFVHRIMDGRLYRISERDDDGSLRIDPVDVDLPRNAEVHTVLYRPHERVLFLGTLTDGLYLTRPHSMHAIRCDRNIAAGSSLYAQIELDDGRLLTMGQAHESYIVDSTSCVPYAEGRDLFKHSLAKDAQGLIWMRSGNDIVRTDGINGVREVMVSGITSSVTLHNEGDTMFIATPTSIAKWVNGTVTEIGSPTTPSERDRPIVLERSPNGDLLYGSCAGLYRRSRKSPRGFTLIPGSADLCVRALEIIQGRLFIGTYGNGAYILENDDLTPIPMDPWGSLAHAHAFVTGPEDALWISTNQGLLRTTVKDIQHSCATGSDRPYYALYGETFGLETWELNGGCAPAYVRMRSGVLSFPSIQGLVQFDPSDIIDPYPTAGIVPGEVLVNGEDWPMDEYLILPHDVAGLSLEFTFSYWGEVINAQLEYRIPGIVENWTLLDPKVRHIEVVRPPPGLYTIHLRKVGSAARNEAQEPILWFRVKQPFARTWQAYLLYGLATAMLVITGIKLNSIRLRNRNRWLEDNVAQQTEALLAANKELKVAMTHQEKLISIVSHDVVPPLRFLARVATSAEEMHRNSSDPIELGETLHDLATSTDKLYHNANGLLAWIRARNQNSGPVPRNIAMHAFVSEGLERVRAMANADGITLVNAVDPEDIVFTDGDLLGVLLNNVLLNAKQHAGCSSVKVQGYSIDGAYKLTVQDDGKGIPDEVLKRINKELQGRPVTHDPERSGPAIGLGYMIIAECSRVLGVLVTVQSTTSGTAVQMDIPQRKGFNA